MQHSLSSPIRIVNFSLLILHFTLYSLLLAGAPDTLWTRTYGGASLEEGSSVQQTNDGGFIVAGYTESFGDTLGDVYLIRTNSNGDTLWTKTYGGIDYDYGYTIKQTNDGGFIIAGYTESFGAGIFDVYLIRTDSNGDTLWTKTHGGEYSDGGYSVQQTNNGGFIITGWTHSFGAGKSDVYLIRTDSNGDTLWTKIFGGDSSDVGNSIQQTSDGGFIVAGHTLSFGAGKEDVYLIRTDSNGDSLWTKTFGGPYTDMGFSVQQMSDGGFIIAGNTSFGTSENDVYLIRTSSEGDRLWTKTYGGTNLDYAHIVQEMNNGGFIIIGTTASFGAGNRDIYLIRTNSNGDTLWTKTYGGMGYEEGTSVNQTSDGGFIIAGWTYSFGTGENDIYLIRLDKDTTGIQEEIPSTFVTTQV